MRDSASKSKRFDSYLATGHQTTYQPRLIAPNDEACQQPCAALPAGLTASPSADWTRYGIAAPPRALDSPATRNRHDEYSQSASNQPSGNVRERAPLPRHVYEIPRFRVPEQRFKALQQWRGTIVEIREGEFDAELRDRTDPSRPREIATFQKNEISEGDEALLRIGAVFDWAVGYVLTPSRQRLLVATIIFRRLPRWTESEITAVRKEAAEIEDLLGIQDATRNAARS
jgi:hypothetical protein